MKLHYSQTFSNRNIKECIVSVPYEITLLSNFHPDDGIDVSVSVPYEITLLSNYLSSWILTERVSVPYEITLLSNLERR